MAKKKNEGAQYKHNPQNNDAAGQNTHTKSARPIPIMLDFTLTIAKVIVILVGLATFTLSLLAGCSLQIVALRTGTAMFSIGLLLWLSNWLLSRNALEALRAEIIKAQHPAEDSHSTIERQA